ncbi:integrase arm-type DNA-binding domain-containing protein [Silicimonas algicola]|nr:integrase arm-type DNA-binding domain-containing protein [Silicimonas algicola]
MVKAFTSKTIGALRSDPDKRLEIPDPALSGLYLVVQPSGAKSWAFRYRHDGRPCKLTLGRWPALGLAAARAAATMAVDATQHGRDPCAEKREARAEAAERADRDLFDTLLSDFKRRHVAKLKSARTVSRELDRFALKAWHGRNIHAITRRDVVDLLDEIAESGRGVTANRIRQYLARFFSWLLEREVIASSTMTGVRPPAPEVSRDRVLTDEEIRWLWRACEEVAHPWGHP